MPSVQCHFLILLYHSEGCSSAAIKEMVINIINFKVFLLKGKISSYYLHFLWNAVWIANRKFIKCCVNRDWFWWVWAVRMSRKQYTNSAVRTFFWTSFEKDRKECIGEATCVLWLSWPCDLPLLTSVLTVSSHGIHGITSSLVAKLEKINLCALHWASRSQRQPNNFPDYSHRESSLSP